MLSGALCDQAPNHFPGGQALLSRSRAQSLMCLAVMKCDRERANVCICAFLNYSGLSAEAHCLFHF